MSFIFVGLLVGIYFGGFTQAVQAEEKEVYAMNVVVSGNEFWIESKEALKNIEKAYGVKIKYGGPLGTNVTEQLADLDTYYAEEIDGLILNPVVPHAEISIVNKLVEAGIPVVTIWNDVPDSKRLCYLTAPNRQQGQITGEYLAKRMGYKGKCVISYSHAGSVEQEARAQGYKDVIEKYLDMELVGMIEDKYDSAIGARELSPLLVKHPDIKAVMGCNNRSGVGAVTSLREMGYEPNEVLVSTSGFDVDVLDLIKKEWISTGCAFHSYFLTVLAFNILYAYNHDLIYPTTMTLKEYGIGFPFPDVIGIPIELITKENADAYYRLK